MIKPPTMLNYIIIILFKYLFFSSNQRVTLDIDGRYRSYPTEKVSKFSIIQLLKDIDAKVLGPDGKKDMGENLDDKDLLNGFQTGYNEAAKEEIYYSVREITFKLLAITATFLFTYYLVIWAFSFYFEMI